MKKFTDWMKGKRISEDSDSPDIFGFDGNIKHSEIEDQSVDYDQTTSDLIKILLNKYREEINPKMKPCSKCLLTIIIPAYKKILDEHSQDYTKWELVDKVGNVFNRLVLFNSKQYHASMDYFGANKENGRLYQVFFFSTER